MSKKGLKVTGILLVIGGLGFLLSILPRVLLTVWILPEKFASTARIIPSPTMTDPVQIEREMEKIRSKLILETVVTNLDLNKKWGQKLKTDDLPIDLAFVMLKSQLEVEQTRKNGVISVTVTSDDRNEAAIIANAIAAVYRDQTKGPDGKPAAQVIDQAEPALRPLRGYQIWPLVIMVILALIASAIGIYLLRKAGRQPIPPVIPDVQTSTPRHQEFSPRTNQVLALARKEASGLNHEFVGTEHLLVGLVNLRQGGGVDLLQKLGVSLDALQAEVAKAVLPGSGEKIVGNIPYTPRVKKVLELAHKQSRTMRHPYVCTEDLILGIMQEGDGLAARVLKQAGLTFDLVWKEIRSNDPGHRL